MIKQEEIRKLIFQVLFKEMEELRPTHAKAWADEITDGLLKYLHVQGVVIGKWDTTLVSKEDLWDSLIDVQPLIEVKDV